MFPDLQVLLRVTSTLERLRVPYLVGGAIASSALGIYRTTQDADVVADLRSPHVAPFVEALSGEFYLDEERIRHAVARRSSFNMIHLERALKVDVYLLGSDPFARQQIPRRRRIAAPGIEGAGFDIASPEDLVLQKLRWYRQGGELSERQWLDVLGVLKVQQPTIDRAYMDGWAVELGVADLLARACAESGYPPRT